MQLGAGVVARRKHISSGIGARRGVVGTQPHHMAGYGTAGTQLNCHPKVPRSYFIYPGGHRDLGVHWGICGEWKSEIEPGEIRGRAQCGLGVDLPAQCGQSVLYAVAENCVFSENPNCHSHFEMAVESPYIG